MVRVVHTVDSGGLWQIPWNVDISLWVPACKNVYILAEVWFMNPNNLCIHSGIGCNLPSLTVYSADLPLLEVPPREEGHLPLGGALPSGSRGRGVGRTGACVMAVGGGWWGMMLGAVLGGCVLMMRCGVWGYPWRNFFYKRLFVSIRIVPLEYGSIFTHVCTLGIIGKPIKGGFLIPIVVFY